VAGGRHRDRGRVNVNVEPSPRRLVTQILPPRSSMRAPASPSAHPRRSSRGAGRRCCPAWSPAGTPGFGRFALRIGLSLAGRW